MDLETVDQTWQQLQSESQQTVQALTALAGKLSAAAQGGDSNAREWMLDLKEIALGIQNEQNQTSNSLQAIHGFLSTQAQHSPAPWQAQPAYPGQTVLQPYPGGQPYPPSAPYPGGGGGGGTLQRFLGGGFGRAIATGAGFGIGDDLINDIFH